MSELTVQIHQKVNGVVKTLKNKVFGHNNERLDFVLDSFYKLSPNQRNGAVAGGIGVLAVIVMLAISLYFSQVRALERDLSDSFSSLRELKRYKSENLMEEKRFDKLVELIRHKTKGLNFKPFFEKLSREKNIQIKDISEKPAEVDSSNPLSSKIKEVRVEMRLMNISIPKLLDFLIEIEKSGHYMRIQDVKISGTYGNKFFFDSSLVIRGYNVANN